MINLNNDNIQAFETFDKEYGKSIVHFNIRSLRAHFDELEAFIGFCKVKPLIICLTETWLIPEDELDIFSLDGVPKIN